MHHKYGWPIREFRGQATQTELDYQTLFDKNAYLAEYQRYFGHRVKGIKQQVTYGTTTATAATRGHSQMDRSPIT
jgi:hypothetical protein